MLFRAFVLSMFLHLIIFGGLRDFEPLRLTEAPGSKQLINASLSSASLRRSGEDIAVIGSDDVPAVRAFKRKRLPTNVSGVPTPSSSTKPFVETVTAGSPERLVEFPRVVTVKPLLDELADSGAREGIREYRLSLAREARRYKHYPAIARELAWQGEVIVDLSTLPGQTLPAVSLGQSSGYAALDAQAVEMMENAARQAPVPESLRGKRFVIHLPINYRLDD